MNPTRDTSTSTASTASTALIVVDVQNDFTENGSLAVNGGDVVARLIGSYTAANRDTYDVVATTQDYHTDPGEHFAAPGTDPDFSVSWPVHCVAGGPGAELDPELDAGAGRPFAELVDVAVYKGHYSAAYSGFEGVTTPKVDPGYIPESGDLVTALSERGVTHVDVVGIATDFCVRATVLDALAAGFSVRVLTDMCAGVSPESTDDALREMERSGAEIA